MFLNINKKFAVTNLLTLSLIHLHLNYLGLVTVTTKHCQSNKQITMLQILTTNRYYLLRPLLYLFIIRSTNSKTEKWI